MSNSMLAPLIPFLFIQDRAVAMFKKLGVLLTLRGYDRRLCDLYIKGKKSWDGLTGLLSLYGPETK